MASICVGQLVFDTPAAYVELNPEDEKNGEGNQIPLRADLVDDLRSWIADRELTAGDKLFRVPAELIRILDRDLAAAGIPKKDERGRTLDVHALRHSFSTLLSKGGVAPRVAQAAMRHSDISLTMTTYTDPKLLDDHGALKALPALPLTHDIQPEQVQTVDSQFAPKFAPNSDKSSKTLTNSDKLRKMCEEAVEAAVNQILDGTNSDLQASVGSSKERAKGLEPSTSSLGS